ncbi:MAG: feuB 4 [Eubacterium sp.]|jgi:iron complex transport system permease protein|nr:feuB 4 [Eubacterium sp.]
MTENNIKLRINRSNNKTFKACLIIFSGSAALLLLMLISITQGAAGIPLSTVIEAFTNMDVNNPRHLLAVDMRLPRVIAAALVGSALAVSGSLMQGMTRNPLADSGLMGLSSGSGLALAICFAFLTGISYTQIVLMSFMGAGLGAVSVYTISNLVPGGNNPMKLILSGAAVSTLLSALSQGIAISAKASQNLAFWTLGSVSGTSWNQIKIVAPVILASLAASIALSRSISVLNMGEEVAGGLGLRIKHVKFIGTLLVVLLAGTSVALAGIIAFVGMLVPHLARFAVGPDYRLIIPASAVLGAILLVAADIVAKTLHPPVEIPIGAIISLLGVPVFLYFAKKQKRGM